MSQPEAPIKYDTERVVTRFAFALLACVLYIVSFHGFSRFDVSLSCNGGWMQAIEFFAAFLFTAIVIELFQSAVWLVWKRFTRPMIEIDSEQSDSVTLSGGGVFFLPRKSLWSVLLAFTCFFIFLSIGTPDPCGTIDFSWRNLAGCVSFAYAALAFGSFVEF
jgi:hypothetical protein